MPVKIKKSSVKKTTHAKSSKTKVQLVKKTGCMLPVFDQTGKQTGDVAVSKAVFDVKLNTQLIAQAVRVYLFNQRRGLASTKTRGEVEGSTRKIYRQKGTGRARHGAIRAPIFVGGGIVFGPKPRDYSLTMPKTMKRKALYCALTQKRKNHAIYVVEQTNEFTAKTKAGVHLLNVMKAQETILFLIAPKQDNIRRSVRNIKSVDVMPATNLNTYDVAAHESLVFTREGLTEFENMLTNHAV